MQKSTRWAWVVSLIASTGIVLVLGFVVALTTEQRSYYERNLVWLFWLNAGVAALLALVVLTGTQYGVYARDTHALVWMLGPATIAYALPIYERRALLRRYPLTLTIGVLTGLALGLASSWLLARLLALPPELAHSLLPRSVSTPFAIPAAEAFGGAPDITVVCVLVTGIFGLLVGDALQAALRLRSSLSRGAAFGAAAHGAGTARAHELGSEVGAVASLTMVFTGVAMVLLAPVLAPLVG